MTEFKSVQTQAPLNRRNIHFANENKLTLFLTALIGAVYSTPSSNSTTAISVSVLKDKREKSIYGSESRLPCVLLCNNHKVADSAQSRKCSDVARP